jgi:hypothetical protein
LPGLIAVFNDRNEEADLKPLVEKVIFRGTCREVDTGDSSCSLMVFGGNSEHESEPLSAAIDGYMVFCEEEGRVLEGPKGERDFFSLFEKEGPSCFENIEGEFTVASTCGEGNCLIARDPLGIKPLYYALDDGLLYLAPEIKALVD